jgi:hypothetical protein
MSAVVIPDWYDHKIQMGRVGRHHWNIPRLIHLASELPVFDLPLRHTVLNYTFSKMTLREYTMHMRAVMNADLKYPIILDEDGELIDGRHRLVKALFLDHSTIKAVRFDKNPSADSIDPE